MSHHYKGLIAMSTSVNKTQIATNIYKYVKLNYRKYTTNFPNR